MTVSTTDAPATLPMRHVALFFLLLLLFSSFADLRFSVGGKALLTMSSFELCSYAVLLSLLCAACMNSLRLDALAAASDGVHRSLLWYLGWGLAAALLVGGDSGRLMLVDLKLLFPAVIGYFGIILMIDSRKKAAMLIAAWTCAGFVNVLLALSQFAFDGPHPVQPGENALEKMDIGGEVAKSLVTGFFPHPNSFSQVIVPYCVVFTTAWLLSRNRLAPRALKLLALSVLFSTVLMLTLAKGAILWAGIAVLVGVALQKWGRLRSLPILGTLWLLLVAAINSIALLLIFNILEYGALRTLFSRIEFIIASINIFSDHPLQMVMGGGIGFWKEYSSIWASWDFPNAHNVFLNQMLFYGVVGFGLFVLFLCAHLKRALAAVGDGDDPLLSPVPYLAAVFALTGSYFFEPSFADPIQKFELLFVLALGFVLQRFSQPESGASAGSSPTGEP